MPHSENSTDCLSLTKQLTGWQRVSDFLWFHGLGLSFQKFSLSPTPAPDRCQGVLTCSPQGPVCPSTHRQPPCHLRASSCPDPAAPSAYQAPLRNHPARQTQRTAKCNLGSSPGSFRHKIKNKNKQTKHYWNSWQSLYFFIILKFHNKKYIVVT